MNLTKAYNYLSEEYNTLYLENLKEFQKNATDLGNDETNFIHFYPSFGTKKNEPTDFLVYGQATNGWSSFFDSDKEVDFNNVIKGIIASNRFLESKNFTPIDLVNAKWSNAIYNKLCNEDNSISQFFGENKYRFHRSFFWNVIYKLVSDYYSFDRESWDWSKKIVWSNLYKIAPDGQNPNHIEKHSQLKKSAELILQEIKEVNPKFCIVLTNINWWKPFQELLKTEVFNIDTPEIIQSVERLHNTTIIVTDRPFIGSSEKYANEILKIIKQNGI